MPRAPDRGANIVRQPNPLFGVNLAPAPIVGFITHFASQDHLMREISYWIAVSIEHFA